MLLPDLMCEISGNWLLTMKWSSRIAQGLAGFSPGLRVSHDTP
jgi:hypothetical protein